jgi:hypothetical protein
MHVAHVDPGFGVPGSESPGRRTPNARPRTVVSPLSPDEIGVEFGDGLPADLSSSIRDEVALQGAGLASQEASLRRLFPD